MVSDVTESRESVRESVAGAGDTAEGSAGAGAPGSGADPYADESGRTARVHERVDDCGIVTLWSDDADTDTLCEALSTRIRALDPAFGLIWFSPGRHAAAALVGGLRERVPHFRFGGCSTSGEITPDGHQERGIVALLLPRAHFRVLSQRFDEVHTLGMEAIARQAFETRTRFLAGGEDYLPESLPVPEEDSVFAMCLIDGLVYAEEAVTTALDRGLDGLPLIGGSAGDDLAFARTDLIDGGGVFTRGALLMLIECRLPFRLFTDNNFVPTAHRLVVTDSDPERRIVHEFNAEPAADAYAHAIGMETAALDPRTFASHALVVRIGGEYYARSIQRVNPDGSLTFFCAIDDGLVLTVARSEGMVRATRTAIEAVEAELGPLGALFGFDCVYRRLDARHRNVTARIETLYREKGFVGFNSYGEQFRSMHINQTFTGVAIAAPREETTRPERLRPVRSTSTSE